MVALVLLALTLNVIGLDWGLPNAYSWSNDDPTPRRALAIPAVYGSGWDVYPYLQLWIDYALYRPYLGQLARTGDIDPACAEIEPDCFRRPHEQLGHLQWLSRAASALMGALLSVAVFATARRVTGNARAAVVAAAAVAGSQAVVFFSHVGNVDIPLTFWFAWSLYALVLVASGAGRSAYIAFGVLAACALGTKESIVGAYVLPLVVLLYGAVREPRRQAAPVIAMLVGLVLVYGTVNNVWFNPGGFRERATYWLLGPGIGDWNDAYRGLLPLLAEFALQTAQGMGLPLAAAGIAGLAVALRRRPRAWPLWLTALSYVLFTIFAVRYTFVRFTLPVIVILAVGTGILAATVWRARSRVVRSAGTGLIAVAIAAAYLGSLQVDWLLLHDARYEAEAWLAAHVPGDAVIESLGSKTHLPRLDYLGYGDERVPDESFSPQGLAARPHAYLVLSSRSFNRLRAADGELLADLLGGRAGYRVVFDAQAQPPVPWILGTVFVESRVNPRIVILERTGR